MPTCPHRIHGRFIPLGTSPSYPTPALNHCQSPCRLVSKPYSSAWHGLHGHRYDFNAHPFTIAGCLVSRHIDKSKNTPTGFPKATIAWAVGPSPNHFRNVCILVKDGKSQYGLQDENQLYFHLPAYVKVHRLPYHAELAAAIHDLTTVLKKTPPTEATGTLTSDDIASLGHSLLEAATYARRVFGTRQLVAAQSLDASDSYTNHYHQLLLPPDEPPIDNPIRTRPPAPAYPDSTFLHF